ncbi:MAG: 50S ribosomal protein L3 [Candidatus Aenigmatarchaeota archaeon]
MAKGHKPVAGSRGFWPRKRAKRIYSSFKSNITPKEAVPLDFAAYKAGMTQVIEMDNRKTSVTHGQEVVKAATVLDCPPLFVIGIRVYKKSRYGMESMADVLAEKLPKDLARKTGIPKNPETKKRIDVVEKSLDKVVDVRLIACTKPRESGIGKKKPELFEICLGGEVSDKWNYAKQRLGSEIKAEEIFKPGDFVDVKAVTKGKGYQGPVKRFGVKIRGRKHTKKRRHIGNLSARNVARVLPGKIAFAGQHGFQTRTEYNKRILKIGSDGKINPDGGFVNYGLVKGHYIILEGSVPGPKKRLIMLRRGIRAPENRKEPVELKKVILESQQGV